MRAIVVARLLKKNSPDQQEPSIQGKALPSPAQATSPYCRNLRKRHVSPRFFEILQKKRILGVASPFGGGIDSRAKTRGGFPHHPPIGLDPEK